MCGVLLLFGPQASLRLSGCLARMAHRGPDEVSELHLDELNLGFVRLAINDKTEAGRQPYRHGNYVSAINGEIFNAPELRTEYSLNLASHNDCHVIAPLFEQIGPTLIERLDGFYAGVLFDEVRQKLYSLRDYVGKKPLFLGRSGRETFVTSELKALDQVDSFVELPSGLCEIDLLSATYALVNAEPEPLLLSNSLTKPLAEPLPTRGSIPGELRSLATQAVAKRLPATGEPVGVFLSGGLDSSIIASVVVQHRPDARYYCLAAEGSADYGYAQLLVKTLGLKRVTFIDLPTADELVGLINEVVFATQSYNPSVISNGICTFMLSRAARADGLKVVLSGEGADELFGGYHHFNADDDWRGVRQQLVGDLRFTELRRVDLTCMAHAIETRCPFLDRAVFDCAMGLNHADLYHHELGQKINKFVLRKAFEDLLPAEIVWRAKTSCDVGSGMRAQVVTRLRPEGQSERQALEVIWQEHFGSLFGAAGLSDDDYFHAYPVFDALIDRRGVQHS